MARLFLGLLGCVLGGGAGLLAGFVTGLLAIDLLRVSCFEGYCGYLVVFAFAPGGLAIGALLGLLLATRGARAARKA